jgi:hypothetical protein
MIIDGRRFDSPRLDEFARLQEPRDPSQTLIDRDQMVVEPAEPGKVLEIPGSRSALPEGTNVLPVGGEEPDFPKLGL